MRSAIAEFILEDVRADIHGDLYGVDRAADGIAAYIYSELISRLRIELDTAYGARGDGLHEAIEIIQEQFREK